MRNEIGKQNLNVSKIDKKLSFIAVQVASEDQLFSKFFTERLVAEATDFYVKTKTKRSKTNVDKLQAIADSLELQLNKKTYSTAVAQDLNVNPIRQVANVETEIRSRDKMVLQTMYAEVVKNLEISKMTMAQETPVVQVIDTPILPLKKERFGKLKGLILGGFVGGFLILIILILRKMIRDVMA
jgi:DNA-directed RNA polymerase specialized sigma subunit